MSIEAIKSKDYLPSILGGYQSGKPSAASAFNGRSEEGSTKSVPVGAEAGGSAIGSCLNGSNNF